MSHVSPNEQPAAAQRAPGGVWWRRGRLPRELALAVLPTLIVLGTTFLVEELRHQRVLFASLASSAFLIYRAPGHPMNGVRVMVPAHLVAVALGVGAAALLGTGYLAGAIAMATTIIALVLLNTVHPPAISTALGFAFFERKEQAVGLFLVALAMLVALVVAQRAASWTARRFAEPEGDLHA
jgi:CBS-domain-containing membrane protein